MMDKNLKPLSLSKSITNMPVWKKYVIPDDDLKLIYDALVEHDIKSLSGLGDTLTEGPVDLHGWIIESHSA